MVLSFCSEIPHGESLVVGAAIPTGTCRGGAGPGVAQLDPMDSPGGQDCDARWTGSKTTARQPDRLGRSSILPRSGRLAVGRAAN